MKKLALNIVICLAVLAPAAAMAKSKKYLYRNRINWVKLNKLSKKQLAGVELQHPTTEITIPQMEAMMQSIEMNKASFIGGKYKVKNIFSIEETKKYAPFIVKALNKAAPNQVVNASVVQKRGKSIVRNNFLTIFNVYVMEDGVHFYFGKLFAKLEGDYMEVSNMDRSIRRAKSSRVSLNAGPGQKLAFNDENEIVLETGFDFAKGKPQGDAMVKVATDSAPTEEATATEGESDVSVEERLAKLKKLKKQGLISTSEYKAKKAEILNDL